VFKLPKSKINYQTCGIAKTSFRYMKPRHILVIIILRHQDDFW